MTAAAIGLIILEGQGFTSGARQHCQALAGETPVTVTDGYAKWTPVDRPLSRALTVFTGYEPVTMTLDLLIASVNGDGWDLSDQAAGQVEGWIAALEWMGGSNYHSGPSPAVKAAGVPADLIPPQYQGQTWIVSGGQSGGGLVWGQAWRNPSGLRCWQEATVTLQAYLGDQAPPPVDYTQTGGYFTSRPGRDTALLIAGAPTGGPAADVQQLASQILSSPRNNPCKNSRLRLARRSVTWRIPHRTLVWVPAHQAV
jgi:hypothetical protein